jgi:hypothetical protein
MAEPYCTEISSNELNGSPEFGQIYLARGGGEPVAALLTAGRRDRHVWLQITAGDIVTTLTLTRRQFVTLVRSLFSHRPPSQTRAPRGVLHADLAEPEPNYKRFNRIQAEWLNGDPAHDWPLFKARFEKLVDKRGVAVGKQILSVVREYYKQKLGVNVDKLPSADDPPTQQMDTGSVEPPPNQLQRDLAILWPQRSKFIRGDGSLNQSAIARLLGGKNAGSFRDDRVLPAARAISNRLKKQQEAA